MQANYAQEIRRWLTGKFAKIQVLALSKEYFEKAEERVILLWLNGYGKETKSIKISFSESSGKKVKYSEINKHHWEESTVVFSSKFNIRGILQRYIDEFGFSNLRKYADVRIGVVTGADKFFILNQNTAVNYGFKKNNLVPIICKSNEFKGLLLNGYKPKTMLIKFPRVCSNQLLEYKKEGEEKEYHLRAHSKLRNPWYDINSGEVPDAFFPYRVSITPYLVFNNSKIQCTNSVHRVYFKGLTGNAKKWVQVSLLSNAGQLALEAYSKTYGSGVLKIEPGSLQNAIIHKGNKKIPGKVYAEIARSIENNDRKNAVKLASKFINETLNIPESLSKKTASALNELQSRRKCRAKKDNVF